MSLLKRWPVIYNASKTCLPACASICGEASGVPLKDASSHLFYNWLITQF